MMTKFNPSEFSEAFRSFTNDSVLNPTQTSHQCYANGIGNVDINNSFSFSESNMFQRFGLNQPALHIQPTNPTIDMIRSKDEDRSNTHHHHHHHLLTHKNLQISDALSSFQTQSGGRQASHQHPEDHRRPHSPDSASLTDYDESSSISSEEHVLTPLACASAGQSRPCLTWACKACKKKSVAVDRRKAATLRERRRLRKVSARAGNVEECEERETHLILKDGRELKYFR